ncbi:hypothetical protein M0804_009417 [Polistes exclamans]|nr:hypothetical protein M0804_009417 [Polistes exclamans]
MVLSPMAVNVVLFLVTTLDRQLLLWRIEGNSREAKEDEDRKLDTLFVGLVGRCSSWYAMVMNIASTGILSQRDGR